MQVVVYRAEGNLGPFSPEQLQQQVEAGAIRPDDLAWHDGLPQWQPVSTFLPGALPASIPPAAPMAGTAAASAEATRLAYLSHEQNVRSIGAYFYFTGAIQALLAVCVLATGIIGLMGNRQNAGTTMITLVVEGVSFGLFAALAFWSAGRFRRLDRSALVPGTILAAFGLLGIPIGTIINAYILSLIYSEKGRFVFSGPYQDVVAATPQIVWKMALWMKIVIGVMIGALVLAFISVVAISVLIALGQSVPHHP